MFPAHKRGWLLQSSLTTRLIRPEYVGSTLLGGVQGSPGGQEGVLVVTTHRTEEILQGVEEEVADLIQKANNHIEDTSWQARAKLVSFLRFQRANRIFRPLASRGGRRRYTQVWQQLLNYVIRISRHTETAQYRNWGIILPQEVQEAADQVCQHGRALRRLRIKGKRQLTRGWDADLAIERSHGAFKLWTSVNTLSMALITPEQRFCRVNEYPLVHFAHVLGITKTGTFHTARSYTSTVAALMWVSRAICLFHWLPPTVGEQGRTEEKGAYTTCTPQTGGESNPNSDNEDDSEEEQAESNPDSDDEEDLEEEEAEAMLRAQKLLDQPLEDGNGSDQGQSDLDPSDYSDLDPHEEERLSRSTAQALNSPATTKTEETTIYFARYQSFKGQQEQYLLFNTEYPFSELASLLTVGLRLAKSQAGPCKVFWSADDRTLRLSNQAQPFSIDTFRAWAQYSLEQAITALNSLVYGMPDHTRLDQPHDIMSNADYHYSLCSGFDQDRPVDIFLHYLRKGQYPDRNGPFSGENGVWHARRVGVYGQQCTIALRLTLIAIHLWGGQPSRGPELCRITIKNGRNQLRNLFWALDQIAIHQPYNKSVSINENGSGITRFAPVQLCLPLLRFLIYVRPALPVLFKAAGLEFSPNNYLFRSYTPGGGEALMTRVLSKGLQQSSAEFGLKFTMQTYRQAAIAIGHRFLLPKRDQEKLIRAEREKILEQQAGHNHRVTNMNYNQDGHLLPGIQRSRLEWMYTLSDDWHRWLEQPTAQAFRDSSDAAPSTREQGRTAVRGAKSGPSTPHGPDQRRSPSISEASGGGLSSSASRCTTPVLTDSDEDISDAYGAAQRESPSVRHDQGRLGKARASKVVNGVKRRYTEAFRSDSEGSDVNTKGRKGLVLTKLGLVTEFIKTLVE